MLRAFIPVVFPTYNHICGFTFFCRMSVSFIIGTFKLKIKNPVASYRVLNSEKH
jgi:hypothetical protein